MTPRHASRRRTAGIDVQQCRDCHRRLFPDRLICPTCGGTDFGVATIERGRIEQVTVLADGTVLASISTADDGPTLIARLIGSADPADETRLTGDAEDPGPAAFVPGGAPTSSTPTRTTP